MLVGSRRALLGGARNWPPRNTHLLGAVVGADAVSVGSVATFNTWNGASIKATTLFCYDSASFAASVTRVTDVAAAYGSSTNLQLEWSIPLTVGATTLAQIASGAADSSFNSMITTILAAQASKPYILIRIGWEMQDQVSFPWGVSGAAGYTSADYIAAYRRLVGLFRAQSSKFKFDWCVGWALDLGSGPIDPTPNYPGDAYVDVIGMDLYYQEQFDGQDVAAAMAYKLAANFGLNWLVTYAAAHSKPIIIPEWGSNCDNAKIFIDGMADWFAANNVIAQCYWDAPFVGAFPTQLSDGSKPVTGAAYQARYGVPTLGPNLAAHVPNYALGGFWYANPGGTPSAGASVDHLPTPIVYASAGDVSDGREAYDSIPPGQFEVGGKYRVRVKFNFGTSNKIFVLAYDNAFRTASVSHTSGGSVDNVATTLGTISNKSVTTVGGVKWLQYDFTFVGVAPTTAIAYRFGPFSAVAAQNVTVFDMQIQKVLT